MKVLLAIDGSSYSDAAIETVGCRPWPPGSEIRVVTVDAPIDPSYFHTGPTVYDDLVRQLRDEARVCLLNGVRSLSARSPDLNVSSALLVGSPQDKILEEAEQWGADLIVVGSHGKGILQWCLLGSVSMAIALYAPCSVEIVRAPTARTSDEIDGGSTGQ